VTYRRALPALLVCMLLVAGLIGPATAAAQSPVEIYFDVIATYHDGANTWPQPPVTPIPGYLAVLTGPGINGSYGCLTNGDGACGFYAPVTPGTHVTVHFWPIGDGWFPHDAQMVFVPSTPKGSYISFRWYRDSSDILAASISASSNWKPRSYFGYQGGCAGYSQMPQYFGPYEYIRPLTGKPVSPCFSGACPLGQPNYPVGLIYPWQGWTRISDVVALAPAGGAVIHDFQFHETWGPAWAIWSFKGSTPVKLLYEVQSNHAHSGDYLVALPMWPDHSIADGIGLRYWSNGQWVTWHHANFPACPPMR
jgi:hypothetical protein